MALKFHRVTAGQMVKFCVVPLLILIYFTNQSIVRTHSNINTFKIRQLTADELIYNTTIAMTERINHIHKLCSSPEYNITRNYTGKGKSIVSVDKTWLTYCPVPKGGWSTWKRLLYRQAGIELLMEDYNHTGFDSEWEKANLHVMMNTEVPVTKMRLVFVRDPYDRLVSAYKDKVLRQDGLYIKTQKLCPGSIFNTPPLPALSFSQFVSCVIRTAHSNVKNLTEFGAGQLLDIHLRPQTLLCNFCSSDYNIIGQMEHMAADVSGAVSYLGMKNTSSQVLHDNQSQSNKTMSHWYNQLNSTLRSQLSQLYSHDFNLLMYNPNLPNK